jgi:hypothetical protein
VPLEVVERDETLPELEVELPEVVETDEVEEEEDPPLTVLDLVELTLELLEVQVPNTGWQPVPQ